MRVLVSFFWWLPVKIMKSGMSFLNLESTVATQRSPRRRPLHTCGASLLAIAQKAGTKLVQEDLGGPLRSMAIRAISFMNSFFPFVYSFLYPFFALLSFIDDHILTFETKVETIFPPSTHLFDKIDGLVCRAEILPEQIDEIFKKIPLTMHRFPFLDWILVRIISQLNCLLSILTHLGSKNTSEKEISIDVNSNDTHICKSEQSEETSVVDQSDFSREKGDPNKTHITETSNVMDTEELVKSYSSDERCNVMTRSRNHIEFEPSKAMTCDVIQKSVDRLCFLRNRTKILDELHFADSPMYTTYQSANSSPVSDCSEGESSPFGRVGKSEYCMNYSYKEMLERGQKEVQERKP